MSLAEKLRGDERILPQVRLGARFGALRELAAQSMFYLSFVTAAVNWSVGYFATPANQFIPLWAWYGALPVLFLCGGVFHHAVVHKSWVAYQTGQGADEEVNPQFRRMVDEHEDLREQLDRIEGMLDEQQKRR